jgi:hypothetical protein
VLSGGCDARHFATLLVGGSALSSLGDGIGVPSDGSGRKCDVNAQISPVTLVVPPPWRLVVFLVLCNFNSSPLEAGGFLHSGRALVWVSITRRPVSRHILCIGVSAVGVGAARVLLVVLVDAA